MSIITFAPAVRRSTPVIIGLTGESGSGKTYSALLLARGLAGPNGRIKLIDTETGRATHYDKIGAPWQHGDLTPPFTPERYIEAIDAAEADGCDVLIVDSASHEWEGIGGILDMAEGTNFKGLAKWANPKARHKKFLQRLMLTRCHLILCLRVKDKFVQSKDDKGKDVIVNQGLVTVQDKRFIYDVTVQLMMQNGKGLRGSFIIEKCPEDLLPAFTEGTKISVESGTKVKQWVDGAAPADLDLRALERQARDEADKGTAALKAFWAKLSRAHQAVLKPSMENFKSIAATADARPPDDSGDPFDEPAPAALPATWVFNPILKPAEPCRDAVDWGNRMLTAAKASPDNAERLRGQNWQTWERVEKESPEVIRHIEAAFKQQAAA